jgi:hypothetical protein
MKLGCAMLFGDDDTNDDTHDYVEVGEDDRR